MKLRRKSKSRNRLILLLTILIVAFAVAFVVYFKESKNQDDILRLKRGVVKPAEYDPGKIVAILPLSGLLKDEGLAAKNGMELAFEDSGVRVSVYYEDWERGDSLSVLSSHSSGVFFVQMPFSMIRQIAETRPDAIILAPASSHEGLRELPNVFSLIDTDSEEGRYVASLLDGGAKGASCLGILVEPDGYGKVLYSAFIEAASSGNTCYRAVEWDGSQDDLSEKLKSLVDEKPKTIWLSGSPQWIDKVYPLIANYGYSGFFLVPSYFDQHMARQIPQLHLKQFLFVRPYVGDPNNAEWKAFFDRFNKRFLRAPEWIDVLFYDAARIYASYVKIALAERARPVVTVEGFRSFLLRQRYFEGVSGRIVFVEGGRAKRSFQLGAFRDGMFVPVENSICKSSGLFGCSEDSSNLSGREK